MRRNILSSKGFGLVELLIAILVMGLGLLAAILGNIYTQQASEASYERIVAMQDSHRTIELMRDASASGNFPDSVTTAYPNGATVTTFNNLTNERVTIRYADPTTDPLDITVTTTWLERGRRNQSIQLRTLMTQR